jgi:hypothetical protein
MDNLSGCLMARLADRDEAYDGGLIEEINRVVGPPKPVGPEEVHIRAMYIVSDQVNSQGGRFAEEELDRLTELLIDAPVMVGHQRDSLPVARNFKAVKVREGDRVWVKSYFYWMKESDGAEALRNNIDGGIYKECSISFLFSFPECSICGRDIRQCRHVPFNDYETASGIRQIAHFLYRRIEKVLETSLVYRGSVADTRITDTLSPDDAHRDAVGVAASPALFCKLAEKEAAFEPGCGFGRARLVFRSGDPAVVDDRWSTLYAFPYQPGLTGTAIKKNGEISVTVSPSLPRPAHQRVVSILSRIPAASFVLDFLLYGMRGKDRLNGFGLMHLLTSEDNPHRLRLRCCDGREIDGRVIDGEPFALRLDHIRRLTARAAHHQLEVLRPKAVDRAAWPPYLCSSRWPEYNFGLEAVVEETDGRLRRMVFSRDDIQPAVVRDANRFQSLVELPNGRLESCRNHPSRAVSLSIGAVALVRRAPAVTGPISAPMSLIDILPGKSGDDVAWETAGSAAPSNQLEIRAGEETTELRFSLDGSPRRLVVHHFSPRLLKLGRRFVADFAAEDDPVSTGRATNTAALETAIHNGRLIMLKMSGAGAVLGEQRRLWIRPVLLDGAERYLVYGETINHPR